MAEEERATARCGCASVRSRPPPAVRSRFSPTDRGEASVRWVRQLFPWIAILSLVTNHAH